MPSKKKFLFFILLFAFSPVEPSLGAESCKDRIERTIREISETRDVRFHGLSDGQIRYRSYILDNEPNLKRHVSSLNETAQQRLAKMYDHTTPADVKYMMETRLLEADFAGGEASIFLNPRKPREAVKIWHESRLEEFEMSSRAMLLFESRVVNNSSLRNVLSVSRIKERGRNYIVKEFSPNSVELKDALAKPEVQTAMKTLKRELSKSSDAINQKLMTGLNRKPPSANFHWDPDQNKILLIDALGF